MSVILIASCLIALILLIWFRTDAWLEYTKLLHLNFIAFYKDFEEKKKGDEFLTYHLYLRRYHDCFLVRLMTCPICIAVWLGICCGLSTYFVLFPVYVIGGLLLFTIIDKLLG